MRISLLGSVVLVAAVALSACVQGRGITSTQPVKVSTIPEGAIAKTNYGDECVTPCRLFLPTDDGGVITVSMDGYETQSVTIRTNIDKAYTTLDAAGAATDPASAAVSAGFFALFGDGMYKKLDRRSIDIVLAPIEEDLEARTIVPAQ